MALSKDTLYTVQCVSKLVLLGTFYVKQDIPKYKWDTLYMILSFVLVVNNLSATLEVLDLHETVFVYSFMVSYLLVRPHSIVPGSGKQTSKQTKLGELTLLD